jgi:hypothetical protein
MEVAHIHQIRPARLELATPAMVGNDDKVLFDQWDWGKR